MKKIIGFFICLFMMTSCIAVSQNTRRVYYDYVITGVVEHVEFVNDGIYSYHIVGRVPLNMYWELYPCDYYVPRYNKSGVFQNWMTPNKNQWVFYNSHRHHSYRPPQYRQPPRRQTPNGRLRNITPPRHRK